MFTKYMSICSFKLLQFSVNYLTIIRGTQVYIEEKKSNKFANILLTTCPYVHTVFNEGHFAEFPSK